MPSSRLEDVPENVKGYPEFTMFEELPSWGFYVRHVKGIRMKDIRLRLKEDDFRPAFVFGASGAAEKRLARSGRGVKEEVLEIETASEANGE